MATKALPRKLRQAVASARAAVVEATPWPQPAKASALATTALAAKSPPPRRVFGLTSAPQPPASQDVDMAIPYHDPSSISQRLTYRLVSLAPPRLGKRHRRQTEWIAWSDLPASQQVFTNPDLCAIILQACLRLLENEEGASEPPIIVRQLLRLAQLNRTMRGEVIRWLEQAPDDTAGPLLDLLRPERARCLALHLGRAPAPSPVQRGVGSPLFLLGDFRHIALLLGTCNSNILSIVDRNRLQEFRTHFNVGRSVDTYVYQLRKLAVVEKDRQPVVLLLHGQSVRPEVLSATLCTYKNFARIVIFLDPFRFSAFGVAGDAYVRDGNWIWPRLPGMDAPTFARLQPVSLLHTVDTFKSWRGAPGVRHYARLWELVCAHPTADTRAGMDSPEVEGALAYLNDPARAPPLDGDWSNYTLVVSSMADARLLPEKRRPPDHNIFTVYNLSGAFAEPGPFNPVVLYVPNRGDQEWRRMAPGSLVMLLRCVASLDSVVLHPLSRRVQLADFEHASSGQRLLRLYNGLGIEHSLFV